MRRNRRACTLGLTLTLAVAGLTMTAGGGRASADASTEPGVWVTAPATGSVVRGDDVDLMTYFDNTACYGDDDAGQWSIDGASLGDDDTVSPYQGGEADSGPGLPSGDYTTSDVSWDSTTVADGPHTATMVLTGTECDSGDAYQETRTVTFTVDNSPIGIHFSRSNGSTISGSAVPLSITTTDPDSTVDEVDWNGPLVKNSDGGHATLDTVGLTGRRTVTVTVTDDADITTTATLTLTVVNPATAANQAAAKAAAKAAGRAAAGGKASPVKATATHHAKPKHRMVKHRAKKRRALKHHTAKVDKSKR